ncbi:Cwf15/Cwc15 cell cycle control protein-domain-containing protein [Cercophora scortea]|uniref:Cwf15/Cwc15 cell cycle control protein-domain-containing protein n=1 Tax=Cercophora scortea TaxID=314031 RepID=A0AAE0IZD9_9PEZI|nr:Cwf15/Cwc15 cell cycle control protein-domain-containing protein [Cercophora scortea]
MLLHGLLGHSPTRNPPPPPPKPETDTSTRQPGQGGAGDNQVRDLRAELLAAEAAHQLKLKGSAAPSDSDPTVASAATAAKRPLELTSHADGEDEDIDAKRRRILEETRDIDADDSDEEEDDDDDDSDSDSDDDDDAELQRELERVRRERVEKREREEREKAAAEEEARERDIALGNPLLNKPDFNIKRRWDDDVVFKNQARGTDDKGKKKEFINVSCPVWRDFGEGSAGILLTVLFRICYVQTSTSGSWVSMCVEIGPGRRRCVVTWRDRDTQRGEKRERGFTISSDEKTNVLFL